MEIKTTSRGFCRAEFIDANGEECSVQESSEVRGERLLLLGIDGIIPGRMHLTQSQVRNLLPVLLRFAEGGVFKDEGA